MIQCRLRAGKDDDLRQAIDGLPLNQDKSDLIRGALRLYFFGNKKNTIHVPASESTARRWTHGVVHEVKPEPEQTELDLAPPPELVPTEENSAFDHGWKKQKKCILFGIHFFVCLTF